MDDSGLVPPSLPHSDYFIPNIPILCNDVSHGVAGNPARCVFQYTTVYYENQSVRCLSSILIIHHTEAVLNSVTEMHASFVLSKEYNLVLIYFVFHNISYDKNISPIILH